MDAFNKPFVPGVGRKLLTGEVNHLNQSLMSEDTSVPAEDTNQPADEAADSPPQDEPTTDDAPADDSPQDDSPDDSKPEPEGKETPKEDESEPEPIDRPTHTMPVTKAQKEKAKAADKAYERGKAETTKAFEERLKALEEANPNAGKVSELLKEREIQVHTQKESENFDSTVAPIIQKDFPGATPEFIKEVKEKILGLIFKPGYSKLPVSEIYGAKKGSFSFKNGYSAETAGGRSSELGAFQKLSDEAEHELAQNDPERYAKYVEAMAAHESKYFD